MWIVDVQNADTNFEHVKCREILQVLSADVMGWVCFGFRLWVRVRGQYKPCTGHTPTTMHQPKSPDSRKWVTYMVLDENPLQMK